jgi:hypothetical protein
MAVEVVVCRKEKRKRRASSAFIVATTGEGLEEGEEGRRHWCQRRPTAGVGRAVALRWQCAAT